jgi:bifunctional non-homologous end joining protein LigD
MLATRGQVQDIARLQSLGYLFDLKIDGVRCFALIDDGDVHLVSRSGVDCTYQYPEVVEALRAAFPTGSWSIDGEIAVNDERGLPSWPLSHKRNAQVKNTSGWAAKLPATYYMFDLLTRDGVDVRSWPLTNRRAALSVVAQSERLKVVLHGDGPAMWKVVETYNLEGLVAKRPESAYTSGRRTDWVKIKRTQTVTALVGGFDPGEGSRASTFGALHLYLLDADGKLTPDPIGKVGSGFSDKELREVMHAMHEPPLIVEVEYLDVSPDGLLRQPVFQRIRKDASVHDCTLDQLTDSKGSHS